MIEHRIRFFFLGKVDDDNYPNLDSKLISMRPRLRVIRWRCLSFSPTNAQLMLQLICRLMWAPACTAARGQTIPATGRLNGANAQTRACRWSAERENHVRYWVTSCDSHESIHAQLFLTSHKSHCERRACTLGTANCFPNIEPNWLGSSRSLWLAIPTLFENFGSSRSEHPSVGISTTILAVTFA